MKLSSFLNEAIRSRDLLPGKESPRAATTPARKAIRKAPDVGQQELVKTLDPKADVNKPGTYRKAAQKIATAATGVEFGDEQDPVDRALDITRGPAAYQKEVTPKNRAQAGKDKTALSRLDTPGLDTDEYDKLSAAERQRRAVSAGKPIGRLDATAETDDALIDARVAAEAPRARQPIEVGGTRVADSAYMRHGTQRSGVNLPKLPKNVPDISNKDAFRDYEDTVDEFLDVIQSANIDPDKQKGIEVTPEMGISIGGIEGSKVRSPSQRDIEAMQPAAEKKAAERGEAYMTKDVMKRQAKLRKALENQDNEQVQALAFQHEVSDDILDRMIQRYGFKRTGKSELMSRVETYGIGNDERSSAAFGGFDLESKFPKASKYRVPDSPSGVYNLTQMKKDGQSDMYAAAIEARGRELLRTYLRQGGRDAYAPHEGLRAMTDMDLEHIRSLAADMDDGGDVEESGGGFDHPTNWVFASGQLNKLRGAESLDKRTQKYVTDPFDPTMIDKEEVTTSYNEFMDQLPADKQKELVAFGNPSKRNKGPFNTAASFLKDRTEEEIEKDRKEFMKRFGASKEQARIMIPDRPTNPDAPAFAARDKTAGQSERTVRSPYTTSPEQYADDIRTMERDEIVYNKGIEALKKLPGNSKKTEDKLLKTREGIKFQRDMAGLGPATEQKRGAKRKAVSTDDDLDL